MLTAIQKQAAKKKLQLGKPNSAKEKATS